MISPLQGRHSYVCHRRWILSPYFFINYQLTVANPIATGFSKAFPGIKPHLLTLASNFKMPLYRDIILAMGICSVSKQSCSNILKRGRGMAITIVVGGATESLSAHPGRTDLTLKRRYVSLFLCCILVVDGSWTLVNRLGFIKVAIQHGCVQSVISVNDVPTRNYAYRADLVPVFSFGENDVRIISSALQK